MTRAVLVAVLLTLAAPAHAIVDPSEALPDTAQESRAVRLGQQFRCLVCQNESIEESGAPLARDLRRIVRERVAAGDSDTGITGFLGARYGDFVRLQPPFRWSTLILWGSPAFAVLAGVATVLLNRRRAPPVAAPLDAAEQARLRELI